MNTEKKIVKLQTLKKKISKLRKQRKMIAFTNGCFDILHRGHIRYLESAKEKNRVLILALNGDRSIRKIKGSKRPILDEKSRASVIAALECIDFVTIFNESTPQKVIEALRPDVLIKGADYKSKEVVGSNFVKSYGGKVEYIKYIQRYSTTKIIDKVIKTCKK